MKNKLIDLNDHLFCQLERLNDEDLPGDELKNEIDRSHAVVNIALALIQNGNLALKAHSVAVEWESVSKKKLPLMLTD